MTPKLGIVSLCHAHVKVKATTSVTGHQSLGCLRVCPSLPSQPTTRNASCEHVMSCAKDKLHLEMEITICRHKRTAHMCFIQDHKLPQGKTHTVAGEGLQPSWTQKKGRPQRDPRGVLQGNETQLRSPPPATTSREPKPMSVSEAGHSGVAARRTRGEARQRAHQGLRWDGWGPLWRIQSYQVGMGQN